MKNANSRSGSFAKKVLSSAVLVALVGLPASTFAAPPEGAPGLGIPTPVYDYRDFTGPNVTERVFLVNGGESVRTQTLTRPTEGELRIDNVLSDDEGPFNRHVWYFRMTDTDFLYYRSEGLDPETGAVLGSEDYDPPLSILQSVMPKGAKQGGATVVTNSDDDIYGRTRSNTVLGLDDVGWGIDGTFSDCLSVFEEMSGIHRVSWFCPGVGLAKRIIGDHNSRHVWELDSYATDQ